MNTVRRQDIWVLAVMEVVKGLAMKRRQKEKQNANSLSYLAIKAHPARQQCVTDRYWTILSDINSFDDFTPHH